MAEAKALQKTLQSAKKNKNDEFYTQLTDIEKEVKHYKEHFKGKTVFCNCDDPDMSNFWKFFSLKFDFLGLKKLISTHYTDGKPSMKQVKTSGRLDNLDVEYIPLKGNGDFRSEEAIEILKECDIVVTNPPFSLFREFMATMVEYDKKFLIIGNNNSISYKETFKLIQENKVWLGWNSNVTMEFRLPEHYTKWSRVDDDGYKYGKVPAISWFTNLTHSKRNDELDLFGNTYKGNETKFPKYDNYDAIDVSKVANIPTDYDGNMGVPITFMTKYNPDQFEIVGITDRANTSGLRTKVYTKDTPKYSDLNARSVIKLDDGSYKAMYARIIIKHKRK